MNLKRHIIDKRDQEEPRIWRGVIYMREPNGKDGVAEPSLIRQRDLCRRHAARLQVEVVGEFVDIRDSRFVRPGLHHALQLAWAEQLDYLIVTSLDVLADFCDHRFEVAWHLGQMGTIPIEAMTDDD